MENLSVKCGEARRRWTESEARSMLAELATSGESAVRFAARVGVSAQRLAYWRKRLRSTGAAFVAVRLPTATNSRRIEIAVHGVAVRVREDLDVEHVARLVAALVRQTPAC